jgi:DNA-binding XRE family transcriptional regulator
MDKKFPQALREWANASTTRDEAAKRLGVSRRAFFHYLRGDWLPPLAKISAHPQLLQAAIEDTQRHRSAA